MPELFGGGGGSGGGGGGGSYTYVSTTAITAVAQIDFTGLAAGYDYIFSFRNALPFASASFSVRLSQAGVFDTASHYFQQAAAGLQGAINLFNQTVSFTAANGGFSADITLLNPGDTTNLKSIIGMFFGANNSPSFAATSAGGRFSPGNNNAVDGIRFYFNAQNYVAGGSIVVFSRKLS